MRNVTSTTGRLAVAGFAMFAGLAACVKVDTLVDMDNLPGTYTERTTTAFVNYDLEETPHEEAQARAWDKCGEAEMLEMSDPEQGEDGFYKITVKCLATYDHKGNLIPNKEK